MTLPPAQRVKVSPSVPLGGGPEKAVERPAEAGSAYREAWAHCDWRKTAYCSETLSHWTALAGLELCMRPGLACVAEGEGQPHPASGTSQSRNTHST